MTVGYRLLIISKCTVLSKEAYKVTKGLLKYTKIVEEIPPETYTDKELIKILSMRNCDPDMYSMLEPAKEDLVRKNNEDYLTHKVKKKDYF